MPKSKKDSYELPETKDEESVGEKSPVTTESRLDNLEGDIKEIARHLKNLADRFEEMPMQRPKVDKGDEDVLPTKEVPQEGINPLITTIQKELSPEFKVEIKPHQPGVSFKLIIIAPERLRESVDDKHVKVIPYLEAETQGKIYAQKVKAYHIKEANRKGLGTIFS